MRTLCLLFFLIITTAAFAQKNTASIKLGHFSPASAEGGFIIGYEGGKAFDPKFSFNWSIDWFHKEYTDKALVDDLNKYYRIEGGELNELRAESNINDLPLMISITGKFPVAPFTKLFFTGGVGAEVLLISYNNFINPDEDDFHAAFDFNWSVGTGLLFEASTFTDLFVQIDYHYSQPGWEYEIEDAAGHKRTFERKFDMSGFMARAGIRFYY